MKHNIRLIALYYEGDNIGNSIQLNTLIEGVSKTNSWILYPAHVINPNTEVFEVEATGSDTKLLNITLSASEPGLPIIVNHSGSFIFETSDGIKNISLPVLRESTPSQSGTIHLTFLYWKGEPKPRDYFAEFSAMARCICSIALLESILSDEGIPSQLSLYSELNGSTLAELFFAANALGEHLDWGEERTYYPSNTPCENTGTLSLLIQYITSNQSRITNTTLKSSFDLAFGTYKNLLDELKTLLNGSNLNPCGDEENPTWEGIGELGEDFSNTASCICKIFSQYSSLSSSEQAMADLLETALSDYFIQLQGFLLSKGVNYSPSENYPCAKANDISRMLSIIAANFNTWDVLPGVYEELKAPLRQIKSIFAEITFSLPTICSGASTPAFKNPILQSPYIYLQACGSDNNNQVEGIIEGLHLRWSLLKELGENHLPKGNLANATSAYHTGIAYNKEDDYVKIYKTPYVNPVKIELNFSTDTPQNIITNGGRIWEIYKTTTVGAGSYTNTVLLRFVDEVLYDSISFNPVTETYDFIQAYTYNGVLEIEVENKLLFAGEFEIQKSGALDATLNFEVIRQADISEPNALQITSRTSITGDPVVKRQLGENIKYFRFQCEQGFPSLIKLETYEDFIASRSSWSLVGDFGLTLTDSVAKERLDCNASTSIDNQWPRYNHGVTTKLQNYEDKWTDTNGIKQGVTEYLSLSVSDTKAKALLNSLDSGDTSKIEISYLESLNLAALDYHIARMLGLGHIDIFDNQGQKYVYIAVYRTAPQMLTQTPFQIADLRDHIYMSLPTDKQDYRLPVQPKISAVTYGFDEMDPEVEQTVLNEGGYGKFDPIRYINIYRDKYDYEFPIGGFFESAVTFDISEIPTAVFHSVEYKETSESTYRIPEINNDDEYTDYGPSGDVSETILLPDSGLKVYTHGETENGVHKYAIYGINLFARSSAISNETTTNETTFTEFLSLKPPHNISAHYIQKEENLLFTTLSEQNELEQRELNNPGGDNSFTRVTFEWNHTQNIAYQTADAVEFYYRSSLPQIVQGEIENTVSLNGGEFINVYTKPFQVASSSPAETVSPVISSSDYPKFVGSIFSTEKERFIIHDIDSGANGPVFKIKPIIEPSKIEDPVINTLFKSSPKKLTPKTGQRFQVVENLASEANWVQLTKTISLVSHPDNHTETEIVEGKTITRHIGGIFGAAEIIPDPSAEPIDGLYKVVFDSKTLPDHPQKDTEGVHWYKGSARISNGIEKKELQVWAIEPLSSLIIWVYDPDFANNPIMTGTGIEVNFHPGYKVYLDNEPLNGFDRTTLLPAPGIVKKDSLIALRAIDSTLTPDAKSRISIPAGLVGINKRSPVKPQKPVGPAFATRPDTFGKSSYTVDVDITGGSPFSLAFYRASDFEILSAIYEPEVVVQIYNDIDALETNLYQHERLNDLANVVFDDDPAHLGEFKQYDGYRLPNTFRTDILNGATTVEDIREAVRASINFLFTPVTPEPVVYSFVKQAAGIVQTLNIPPVIRNEKGHRLSAGDLPFNPYPFAVKFTENSVDKLRFTDYSLDGAAKSTYFYFVREISREMVIGERSDIIGPVRLVNAMPADAPYIRKVETVLADPFSSINAGVRFYINPYHPDENIKKVAIYRTTDIAAASSINLMQPAGEADVTNYSVGVTDNFADLDFPLFNETIYYRLVALREIINESGQVEYIPSLPSNIVEGRVVDNVNPVAPELSFTVNSFTSPPAKIANIDLSWEPTAYNGKYYLYKMTSSGNWQKVYEVASNQLMTYTVTSLDTVDDDGDTIYHRYKVDVENANGLLNLDEKPVVISGPAWPTNNLKMMFWDASPSFYPSTGNVVTDLSGNGNYSTLSGFASPGTTTSGYYNNSLYYDGLNDRLNFVNTWLLNKTEFSFYTIFKVGGVPNANGQYNMGILGPEAGGSSLQLVRLYGVGTYYTPTVYLNGSITNISIDGDSANITQKIFTDLSKFYHVAFTVKAGEIKLYVDGELIHVATASIGYLNTPLRRIGWYGSVQQWKGQIPVVMGYDKVITEQEIQQIYTYFKDRY